MNYNRCGLIDFISNLIESIQSYIVCKTIKNTKKLALYGLFFVNQEILFAIHSYHFPAKITLLNRINLRLRCHLVNIFEFIIIFYYT